MFAFQTLNMLNYVNTNSPPIVSYFLRNLEIVHLNFLPNVFAPGIPANCTFNSTLQKVIDLNTDNMFIRNDGYILFIALFYLLAFGIFKLLTVEKVIKSRQVRQFCEGYLEKRFNCNILFEATLPLFYRLIFFSFVQFTQFSPLPCAIGGFSIAMAILSLLGALAIPGLIFFHLFKGRLPLKYNYPLDDPNIA